MSGTIKLFGKSLIRGTACVITLLAVLGTAEAQDVIKSFDIAAQPLAKALIAYSQQADTTVVVSDTLLTGKSAPAVRGNLAPDRALELLLRDSGLKYSRGPDGGLTIELASAQTGRLDRRSIRVAQADTATTDAEDRAGEDGRERLKRDEIIVTGTNIRGVSPDSSPSFVFDREAIERTGVSTTERFIETLPQNFSGGVSEISFLGGTDEANIGNATGVNLRGLGAGSTLTLLDGRRLAPGSIGNVTDLSMIPLSIIERIDVVTDGASAIYGSDAIGGVVNFTTRKDFDGAQTTLRGGTVTDGGHREFIGSQSLGKSFGRGNILGVYEYRKRTRLSGADREFAKSAPQPFDILPDRERHSVFVNGNFEATKNLSLDGHLLYGSRQAKQNNVLALGLLQFNNFDVDQLTVSGGGTYDFAGTWQLDLQGLFSRSKTESNTGNNGVPLSSGIRESTVWSADAKLDGTVFSLPGGDVKLAMGGHYRKEKYDFSFEQFGSFATTISGQPARDVYAVFGEAFVPLVSEDNQISGVERLEVTAAGRFEDYSEFGSTTNPKVGLLWSPVGGLNLRGTWGTSFKAPLLDELFNPNNNQVVPLPGFFLAPSADGTPAPTILGLFGSNPNLKPEEATTWTAGFDLEPRNLDGFRISATYYDIDYTQRIGAPITDLFNVFAQENLFTPFIDRSPDPAALADFTASPFFMDFFGIPITDVMAIVDNRLANSSKTKVNGVDFLASYNFEAGGGQIGLEFGGTYILKFENQLDGGSPPVDVVNTVFHPVGLKLRGGANWSSGPLSINTFVNYVDSYEDNRPSSLAPIDSFTTVDLSLAYDFSENVEDGLLGGSSVSLSVSNLFDQDPPFVQGDFTDINFDGTNANPIGRFMSLQVRKTW